MIAQATLGIDISKKEIATALLINGLNKSKKFSNDMAGFSKMSFWLEGLGITQVKACMEATGSYGEKLADYLFEKGHQVHVINPACIKAFAKSKLSRHKTDEVDALLIAEFASKNDLRLYKPKDPQYKELQALYRCVQSLKLQHLQVSNLLENRARFPESVEQAYETLIIQISIQIEKIEACIDQLLSVNPLLEQDCKNLQTIPGVGKATAVAVLAEIPAISCLNNARQLAAYVGLTPCLCSSGTSVKRKERLSKIGSYYLRKALFFPAIVAKKHNPFLREFAKKLLRQGKHKMVVIGAIMRKLVHIIFGILKHKVPFNPEALKSNPAIS